MSKAGYESLRASSDFQKVFRGGISVTTGRLAVHRLYHSDSDAVRVGFVVSKKIGGAVVRNKVRRRLREVVRRIGALPAGSDTVFVARAGLQGLSYQELEGQVTQIMEEYAQHNGPRS